MKTLAKISALALTFAVGTAANAMQDVAAPAPGDAVAPIQSAREGATLTTSDGKRLGRIKRVENDADGNPARIGVIDESRFVYIPAETVSAGSKGFVTSLTRAEVRRLK